MHLRLSHAVQAWWVNGWQPEMGGLQTGSEKLNSFRRDKSEMDIDWQNTPQGGGVRQLLNGGTKSIIQEIRFHALFPPAQILLGINWNYIRSRLLEGRCKCAITQEMSWGGTKSWTCEPSKCAPQTAWPPKTDHIIVDHSDARGKVFDTTHCFSLPWYHGLWEAARRWIASIYITVNYALTFSSKDIMSNCSI